MKFTKKVVEGLKQTAIVEKAKNQVNAERQQGVVNLCEWILQNIEFDEDLKGDSNGNHGDGLLAPPKA